MILGHSDLELQVSGQEKLALRTVTTAAAVQVIFDEIDPHYFSNFSPFATFVLTFWVLKHAIFCKTWSVGFDVV